MKKYLASFLTGLALATALMVNVQAQGPFSAQIQAALRAYGFASPGVMRFADGTAGAPSITFASDPDTGIFRQDADRIDFTFGNNNTFTLLASKAWIRSNNGELMFGASADLSLIRDAANVLAQRNGTSAQTYRIYNTYTDASNYERANIGWAGNVFVVGTAAAGTGSNRSLNIGAVGGANVTLSSAGFQFDADNTYTIGASNATRPASVFLGSPAITIGAGTGLTLVNSGEVRTLVYKFTVASTAFVCAAVTCDVTVGTLPAKTFVSHAIADLTTTFACTATCTTATLSATLGKTAGGNQYLISFDADAATAQFGDAAAELGASLNPATVPTINGDVASWSGTTAVVMRLTSAVGNIGDGAATNLSQGTVTFYITTTKMP